MKKFVVFAFDQYYPSGGCNDIHGIFETEEEAKARKNELLSQEWDYVQVWEVGTDPEYAPTYFRKEK